MVDQLWAGVTRESRGDCDAIPIEARAALARNERREGGRIRRRAVRRRRRHGVVAEALVSVGRENEKEKRGTGEVGAEGDMGVSRIVWVRFFD
ncbi:hypothetical protein JCGZ_09829 [Jatropha curcas]|uniref:Uncharacterized protein n=1 Tax=Jatropha curcas TaxID=180498 RepID=A0A067KWR9_JATCU|nr:hypothetical protein JCGZ_09829 [Jatropha curcas]